MKVSYALQVMSRTVAAAITLHATHGKLPRTALPTATLLLRLNDLLDVLNSSARFDSCSKRRAISSLHPATAGNTCSFFRRATPGCSGGRSVAAPASTPFEDCDKR